MKSWWALYGKLPLPFLHQQNSSSRQFLSNHTEALKNETSRTGSNTDSIAEGDRNVNKSDDIFKDATALNGRRDGSEKSLRGFVPYKRCVVDREGKHPQVKSDEGEGQSVRLCL
ncbi:uncharacterized protein A4U43_C04F4040 [Asparagus officinalis]|uniref:Uncharacterized protein n=2 Tax=Asparagus officinalis TaxID=4686 RepID=A0A5P1EY60_ASPOF|nr:uncharacterized protein A4U43_C04F4040 [Asparagus officinalis]